MIAGMKAMRLEASDAESSRVDARRSTVVGDASSSWKWCICTIKTMFIFERCDAMPHNYPLVRWLIGCTSLIHDSIDTFDASGSLVLPFTGI